MKQTLEQFLASEHAEEKAREVLRKFFEGLDINSLLHDSKTLIMFWQLHQFMQRGYELPSAPKLLKGT
ncbi:hypothetical protein HYY69_06435 [Candidatus Woesearchaeota archaeon]|nr:hypothetical protein [Candidatus Woesearchaeota archaeon]